MDPVTIATAAVVALAPYGVKAGEAIAEEVGKQGLSKAEAILKALWSRWRGKPEAESRLKKYVQNPSAGRDELTATLALDIATDHAFGIALEKLLENGPPEVFVRQFVTQADEVIGAEIHELLRGRVVVDQVVGSAKKVIGPKIDRVGGD